MVKSSVSVSGPVAWSIIGRSNATIVQKDGVAFARNLGAKSSYKYSVAQPTVDVRSADKAVELVTPSGVVTLKGSVKKAEAAINAAVSAVRPDLRVAALRKYSELRRSTRGSRANKGQVKTGRNTSIAL